MPVPIVLGTALLWGARVATALAVSYACEQGVAAVTDDNPIKYACYLIPGGGAGKALGGGARLAKILIKRPSFAKTVFKTIGGKVVSFIVRSPRLGIAALARVTGGLLRAVVLNPLVQAGVFVALFGAIVNTTNYVINFNINQSDDELLKKIEEQIKGFYGLLGGAVGSATGFLMCGALPGTLAFAFNPGVAAVAMAELDDEARSEVYGQAANIGRLTLQTLINAELSRQFMNKRRYLKRNISHPVSRLIQMAMGKKDFEKWGESNQPSFTIKENIIDKNIENIKDDGWKQFVENFVENFSESCVESGFIIANTIDSQIAANILAQRQIIGNPTDVSIILNAPPNVPGNNNNNRRNPPNNP